jgi:outer membrane immunogenic protein
MKSPTGPLWRFYHTLDYPLVCLGALSTLDCQRYLLPLVTARCVVVFVGGAMRQIIASLLGATALSLACAHGALAADMPVKAPAYIAPLNWGGWYLGGNVGYGWGNSSDPNLTFVETPLIGFTGFFAAGHNVTPNLKPTGVIGGVQVGYNWMVSPNWVVGLVTDFQGSGVKASGINSTPAVPIAFSPTTQSNSLQTDWFGTVRAKLGVAQNNWLVYGTGGLAYGHVNTSGTFSFITVPPVTFTGSNSTTKVGWAIGAGLDYGVTRNWIVGVEYLYIDLDRVSYTETNVPFAPGSVTISNRAAMNIVRLTANYKF